MAVSAYLHKYDETNITPEHLAAIKAEWIKQRDSNLVYWAGEPELIDAMAVGDVWLAYAWQGAYAALSEKRRAGRVRQSEKRVAPSWVGVYGIRKGGKEP